MSIYEKRCVFPETSKNPLFSPKKDFPWYLNNPYVKKTRSFVDNKFTLLKDSFYLKWKFVIVGHALSENE